MTNSSGFTQNFLGFSTKSPTSQETPWSLFQNESSTSWNTQPHSQAIGTFSLPNSGQLPCPSDKVPKDRQGPRGLAQRHSDNQTVQDIHLGTARPQPEIGAEGKESPLWARTGQNKAGSGEGKSQRGTFSPNPWLSYLQL